MFGRETSSSLRDAAQRVNSVGYDASLVIGQLEHVGSQVEDTLHAWRIAGQAITIAAAVMALALVIGIGVSTVREL